MKNRKKGKNNKMLKSTQRCLSKVNNTEKNKNKVNNNTEKDENKCKSMLFKGLAWFGVTVLAAVIATCIDRGIPILLKQSSFIPPSLDTSKSEICANSIFRYVVVPRDTNANSDAVADIYLALQTRQTGNISINLTNNDESTLVVNDIYLDLVDYQPINKISLLDKIWGGNYSNPVYYGVQLGNLCKKYKCTLLDRKSAENFLANYELPAETNFKVMGEQIEYNNTDEIEIIFSPLYQGIYRLKIVIDYSIRSFNNSIESGEFRFVSLDSSYMSQN